MSGLPKNRTKRTHRVPLFILVGLVFGACGGRQEAEPTDKKAEGGEGGARRNDVTSDSEGGGAGIAPTVTDSTTSRGGTSNSTGGASNSTGGTSNSTGGTSNSTGGASNSTGGASNSTGGTVAFGISRLKGDYDVFIAPPPEVTGCAPNFGTEHVTLWLDTDPRLSAVTFVDYQYELTEGVRGTIIDNTLYLPAALRGSAEAVITPAMQFTIDESGFVGTGMAEVTYRCNDGSSATSRVKASVVPDRTPPTLRIVPFLRQSPDSVFPFSEFRPEFSEPVTFRNASTGIWFWDPSEAEATVQVVNAVNEAPIALDWRLGMAAGESVFQFINQTTIPGQIVRPRLMTHELTDHNGNRAVADPKPWNVVPVATLNSVIDFDENPNVGFYGKATYEFANRSNHCQSGGCLILEGNITDISARYDTRIPDALFAFSFTPPWPTGYRVRYQIWSSSDRSPVLTAFYPNGCTGYTNTHVQPIEVLVDGYTMSTGWADSTFGYCGGPGSEHGIAFALAEEYYYATSYTPKTARLVIERIEVINE